MKTTIIWVAIALGAVATASGAWYWYSNDEAVSKVGSLFYFVHIGGKRQEEEKSAIVEI